MAAAFLPWEKWLGRLVRVVAIAIQRFLYNVRRRQSLARSSGWIETEAIVERIECDSSLPREEIAYWFTTAGGRELGRIVSVDPGRQLTGTITGAFMSYVLVAHEHDVTRLLLKVVMRTSRWAALGLCVGDLIMARRQLLNFKQLAERHQCQVTAPS